MDMVRIALKVVMWVLIIGFGCNFIMQTISYSFYKGAKHMSDVSCAPVKVQLNDKLTGYEYNMDAESDHIIIYFGGSNYIAYNSVGKFAAYYDVPFISADYYGTQDSAGKMNLKSMQQTARDLYNKIIPIFWGPGKVFISNNMKISEYAKKTTCKAYIIGSYQDKTLGASLQEKVSNCYNNAKLKIFEGIGHEQYLENEQVVDYIKTILE